MGSSQTEPSQLASYQLTPPTPTILIPAPLRHRLGTQPCPERAAFAWSLWESSVNCHYSQFIEIFLHRLATFLLSFTSCGLAKHLDRAVASFCIPPDSLWEEGGWKTAVLQTVCRSLLVGEARTWEGGLHGRSMELVSIPPGISALASPRSAELQLLGGKFARWEHRAAGRGGSWIQAAAAQNPLQTAMALCS